MKIADIALFKVAGHIPPAGYPRGDRACRPLDVYPEFNAAAPGTPSDRPRPISGIYVEVLADEGLSGLFGPIQEAQAYVIQRSLRPLLLGRDPLANELLLDLMLRLDRHGRTGMFMTGVSPVDCALWDLKGKAWNQPVYRLLGGPTRPSVPAYASMLGFSLDPEVAAATAREYQAKGFTAQKWFFRYGPGDGEPGKGKNIATAKAIRQAVGPDYALMFDAVMGWDTTYAVDMVKRLAPVNPTWMEEPIAPERVGGLRKIQEAAGFPIATGEHVYTRWQVKELLVRGAVGLLQTDPDWTGGITELTKICALASAFEVPVVAHGHSLLAALHVAGAQSPTTVPRVEYLIHAQETKQFFHNPVYRPDGGEILLPDLPGLGLVIDEGKVEARTVIEFRT